MASQSRFSISRRRLLQAIPPAIAAPSLGGVFVPLANAQEPLRTGYTICDHCNHMPMCGIKFQACGNVVVSVESWKEHPQKILCNKGLATLQRLYNPNRLLYPMKRTHPKGSKDPGFKRIGWDEALSDIAKNLLAIRAKHGADSVMFYCGDPKEPRPPVARLARHFGSVHYGNESSVSCRKGTFLAEELIFGQENSGSGPNASTNVYMLMATNKAWSAPTGFWNNLVAQKKRGMKIITVDVRRTKCAELADIHLQPRQGTDAALAAGMVHVLIRENLYNREFVDKWCHGFDELAAYVKDFPPERAESITGVPAADIVAAARMYAQGVGGYSLTSQSLSHTTNGVNNARALLVLPAILGYMDVPGGAMFDVVLKDYICWDNGMTKTFSGYNWFAAPEQKARRLDAKWVPVWNEVMAVFNPNQLPEHIAAGKIKALAAWGYNVMIWPQSETYAAAVARLDFAFAVDHFYREATHRDLDIILPAAVNFERYAPFGVHGTRITTRTPVKPLGEAREDWAIALQLGCLIDKPENFFDGDPVKACDSMLNTWGVSYAAGQARLPEVIAAEGPKQQPKKYEKGLLRDDGKPGFNTRTGKIELFSTIQAKHGLGGLPVHKDPIAPTPQYPLKLINGTRAAYITHSKTRWDAPYLLEIEPMSTVDINPVDAEKRAIREGDRITLTSAYGKARARARVSIIVPPGLMGMQYGWPGEQNSQMLIDRRFDAVSGYPAYFEMVVEVTKDNVQG